MFKELLNIAYRLLVMAVVLSITYLVPVIGLHFPYDTGHVELPPLEENVDAQSYYNRVYKASIENTGGSDHEYVDVNRGAAKTNGVLDQVQDFVTRYGLEHARTLEVGAGSGQLQDIVNDYTGLDIAASAAHYFHKPFVQGSALELPFDDNVFDAAWTVWTLEHVPDPEKAMEELRRVTKPGGMIFFFPAWNCTSWAAAGYEVRPYENLSLTEKAAKASLAIRAGQLFRFSYLGPTRLIRYAAAGAFDGPTQLRYTALRPNYTNFWKADSDAIASIDAVESMVWFESRGDTCLNCPASVAGLAFMPYNPLHIRVGERSGSRADPGLRITRN